MRTPEFIRLAHTDTPDAATEAAAGLATTPARAAPKFLYDALGSRLFDAITELPEYYPTRTERAIFAADGAAIASEVLHATGPAPVLVDLGADDCAKAEQLLFAALAPRRYVAVDIAEAALRAALPRLQRDHPGIEMVGVELDFSVRLQLPERLVDGPALVFYPGSSIGNFDAHSALRLLRDARTAAHGGALLIGVDLVKPKPILDAAYDDALGVTAAFNLNLLNHLNRVLGADFDVRDWRHRAFFDQAKSRIEMHLEARRALSVHWRGGERRFAAGETIHTENSAKWLPAAFETLLRDAGFGAVTLWTDAARWFAVFLARG